MFRLAMIGLLALFVSHAQETKKASNPLKVIIVSANEDRSTKFCDFLTENGFKTETLDHEKLSKENVKNCDVVLIDPASGNVNDNGQSGKVEFSVKEDLGKPIVAIGAAGSCSLIPLKIKFGNNG